LIATIAFASIVEEVLARWEDVTNGNEGMRVRTLDLFGLPLPRDGAGFYYLCLAVLVGVIVMSLNLLRSPTGRAFVAIRDSETAAKSMGIDLAGYKVKSFANQRRHHWPRRRVVFAHKMTFISPEMFTLLLSIEFIMVIIIGGAFGLHGAVFGAIFMVMVDPFLTALKDDVPVLVANVGHSLGMAQGAADQFARHDVEDRLGSRPQGRDLRPHHHDVHRLRALRPLWPLAESESSSSSSSRSNSAPLSSGRRPT